MSWDLVVMDLPPGIKSFAEIANSYKPRPLGTRADIIAKISSIFPQTDFSDPSRGILIAPGCLIEFSMGSRHEVDHFVMHVRGVGKECPETVAHILAQLDMRALDMSSESGLFEQDPDLRSKSFERWHSFRSHVHDLLDKSTDTPDNKRQTDKMSSAVCSFRLPRPWFIIDFDIFSSSFLLNICLA